jgi:hypothetical protein
MSHGFARLCADKPLRLGVDFGDGERASWSETFWANGNNHRCLLRCVPRTGTGISGIGLRGGNGRGLGRSRTCSLVSFLCPFGFGRKLGQYFADMIIADKILLALKAARNLESAHEGQLLHYLKASEIEVGRLLNFGMRPQFRRLLFDNERKKIRAHPCASVAKVSA